MLTNCCLVSHGDQEICRAGVYFAMMNVFMLQLMCVLMQSQVYSVMYTAAFKKFFMDLELLHHKLSLSVSLLDTTNLDLNEEEVDNMP